MEIKYFGHACFQIKDGNTSIITDPYSNSIGLKLPKLSATMVTVSSAHENHNNTDAIDGDPKVFDWPGEFENAGVYLKGLHSFHNSKDSKEQEENIIFAIHFNGIKIAHLGAQGTTLTSEQLQELGDVDVLLVPVSGKHSIDAKKAKEVIEQIEPRVVIPMMYGVDGDKSGNAPVDAFLSAMGASANAERVDTYTFKKAELPEENTKVVVVKPQV